ncbi:MAG: hypothetical protein AMJ46_00595 [Latescibacteria bacterium DG_63]|nr:MAG: hypothetical protein AMJ46_00595 [Latescibacteria bacterium DG_63]
MISKVAVYSTRSASVYECVKAIFERLEWTEHVGWGASVVLKPNLSWPGKDKAPYANTSREVLDAVIKVLLERTNRITVGESDGTRFSVDECFEASDYGSVIKKNGVRWVNFSRAPSRAVEHPLLRGFELPEEVLGCDVFITIPKLKTHGLTYFTGALKNQWGCIPRHDRIVLHRYLNELIVELNTLLKPAFSIMDGILAMGGRGPVNGTRTELGILLGSRDPVALDAAAIRLVGLDPLRAEHLVLAAERGLGKFSEDEIDLNGHVDGNLSIEPAKLEHSVRLMNFLTRYPFFTYRILLNDRIFRLGKGAVSFLRRFGLS